MRLGYFCGLGIILLSAHMRQTHLLYQSKLKIAERIAHNIEYEKLDSRFRENDKPDIGS